jgi:isoquinoline 1-oxidoreductase beta subunit
VLDDGPYVNGCIHNVRIETSNLPMHLLTGQFRGPGYNSHCFIIESFIDECAARAGFDPLEYRLRLLSKWPDPGWLACLREVAARAGWGRKLPARHAQGLAIGNWGTSGKPREGTTAAQLPGFPFQSKTLSLASLPDKSPRGRRSTMRPSNSRS